MDLEMVLNELSLNSVASDIYVARQRMSDLIQTTAMATRNGVKNILRTQYTIYSIVLAPDYTIASWLKDAGVDKEARRRFRSLITKSPFLEDINDPSIQHGFGLSEFFHDGDLAIGLGVAYWLEALAISLRSEARWHTSRLHIKITQLDENGEMTDTSEEITHASSYDHIQEQLIWIQERLRKNDQLSIHNGATIWEQAQNRFPNLYFSERAREQMQELQHGHTLLLAIVNRLDELENFCKNWNDGPFDANNMVSKITNESQATMDMYGTERTFLCHDGVKRTFRWHARLTPSSWRLYFYPLPNKQKLIIGYIGPHLRTVSFH